MRYYEIEALRRAGSLKQWVVIAFLGVTSLASLLIAFLSIMRPIPVVAFDRDGRALVFNDTYTPALEMTKVRADWFIRYFLSKYLTVDSTRLDEDLTTALNLMTPDLRDIVMEDGGEVERRKKYQGGNVRSRLEDFELRIGDFDPMGKAPIYAIGWGKHVFEPVFGGTDKDKAVRWLFVKLQIDRYAVTKLSPHGLLVHYVEWKSYDSEPELNVELLKVQRDATAAGGAK